MKLDEAIEILTDFHWQESELLGNEFREAVQLGNEAINRIQFYRKEVLTDFFTLLPGETEE